MVAAAVAGTWEGRRAFHIHTTGKEAFLEKVCGKKCSITECRRGSILFAQTGSKVLTIYIHRESAGKNDVRIYDYVDANLGLCITMFRKRMTTYRKMGYSVEIPADSHLNDLIGRRPGSKSKFPIFPYFTQPG